MDHQKDDTSAERHASITAAVDSVEADSGTVR
jgi:hypothetical protein